MSGSQRHSPSGAPVRETQLQFSYRTVREIQNGRVKIWAVVKTQSLRDFGEMITHRSRQAEGFRAFDDTANTVVAGYKCE